MPTTFKKHRSDMNVRQLKKEPAAAQTNIRRERLAVSEFDKPSSNTGASPTNLPTSRAKMRDVAIAAGVSVATVSNVINHPHRVATCTRERVECVIRELDFIPDPNAKALRSASGNIARPEQGTAPGTDHISLRDTPTTPARVTAFAGAAPAGPDIHPDSPEPGQHLSLKVGPEFLSGTVDLVMPDHSCFWIWVDGGMGRRLIDSSVGPVTLFPAVEN